MLGTCPVPTLGHLTPTVAKFCMQIRVVPAGDNGTWAQYNVDRGHHWEENCTF